MAVRRRHQQWWYLKRGRTRNNSDVCEHDNLFLFSLCSFFFHVDPPHPVIFNQRGPYQVRTAANTHTVAQHYQLQKYTLHCIFQLIRSDYVIIHQSILCDDPPPALLNPTTCLFNSYFLGLQFVVLTVFHTC